MIKSIVSIALFHIGAALEDISEVVDPESPEPELNEDTPGWVDSLTETELPEE